MAEKKKQEKKSSSQPDKLQPIFDILSSHKLEMDSILTKIDELSISLQKVKGRMGL